MHIGKSLKSIFDVRILFVTFLVYLIFFCYLIFFQGKNVTSISFKIPTINSDISLDNLIKSSEISINEKNWPIIYDFISDKNKNSIQLAYSIVNSKSNLKKLKKDFNKRYEYKIKSIVFDYKHWHTFGNKNDIVRLDIYHNNNDLVFINNLKIYLESMFAFNNLNTLQNKILSKKKVLDDMTIEINQSIIDQNYILENLFSESDKKLSENDEEYLKNISNKVDKIQEITKKYYNKLIRNVDMFANKSFNTLSMNIPSQKPQDYIIFLQEMSLLKKLISDFEKSNFEISTTFKNDLSNISNYQYKDIINSEDIISFYNNIDNYQKSMLDIEKQKKSLNHLSKSIYAKGEVQDFDKVLITNKIKNILIIFNFISYFILTYVFIFFINQLFRKYKMNYQHLFRRY